MKRFFFMGALIALSACTQMAPNTTGREPNQYREDREGRREDRRNDRRDDRRDDRRPDLWKQ